MMKSVRIRNVADAEKKKVVAVLIQHTHMYLHRDLNKLT